MGVLIGITALLLASVHSAVGNDGLYVSNSTHILFQADSKLDSSAMAPVSVYANEDARIVGLAVDVDDKLVFWSDISFTTGGIYKGSISDGGSLVNVERIISDVSEVNGIAVDWHRNYIYWTDCGRHSVELARYDGSDRLVLSIDGLHSPRGIAVDVKSGYLFWNDQGTNKIERSRLDGSDRQDFATDNVEWPNQMAVRDSFLYCVDGKTLNVMQYAVDGSSDKSIGSVQNYGANAETNHPFGLAVDGSFVYVSIWYTSKVVRLPLSPSNSEKVVLQNIGIEPIFSLANYDSDNQPSASNDPCASKSCDRLCLPTASSARCTCSSFGGQTLQSDGTSCADPTNLLFYVLADEGIVAFKDLDGGSTPDRSIIGRSLRPVAVAYDPVDQYVYWSDVHERTIHKAKLDGTDHTIFMSSSSHSIGVVDGLAVDPVRRKLYYSNMGSIEIFDDYFSWHRIELIGLDGSGRKTIVDNVEMPRGLYVDYTNGYLYYTDWGSQASVVKVQLDGSDAEVIRTGLDNPNSLTMTESTLYVVDSHYKTRDNELNPNYPGDDKDGNIYSFDGTDWTGLNVDGLETPFGLTSYNNKLYVSDWAKQAIYEVTTAGVATPLMSSVVDPMGLFYSNRTMTQGTNKCSSESCDEVCVVSDQTAECVCDSYNGKILTMGGNCATPDFFILTGDFNAVKLIDLSENTEPGNEVREPQVLIEGSSYFSNFVSLAYDDSKTKLYYTDVNRRMIYSTAINDTANSHIFYQANTVIDGMDLSDGKLYWTAFENGSIYSTDISDNTTTLLISGLSRPRAIKVSGGYIYWTEWGQTPSVVRASTDGNNKEVLVYTNVVRPNGLDVDTQYIYIGEAMEPKFIRCNLDGSDCRDIEVASGDPPQHIYSIKKQANRIYYTDWKAGTLSQLILDSAQTSGTVIHLAENLMRPTEIIVKTGTVTPCPSTHGCSDECLDYFGGYSCTCPANEYLKSDGKTCGAASSLPSCSFGGNTYQVGDSFSPEVCVSCICEVDKTYGNPDYGNAVCTVMTCPVLTCSQEQQETPTGECCPRCADSLCSETPVSINECTSGTYTHTIDLPSTLAYAEYEFGFEGRDNCNQFREVTITYEPKQSLFPWRQQPYQLTATAQAPTSGAVPDTFTCQIELTIADKTPPVLDCPSDQTLYHQEESFCISEPTVHDNVCGEPGQQDCTVEGDSCQQFSVGPHTVDYTAMDQAGNEVTCTSQVEVIEGDFPCNPFNVQNGDVDCSKEGCTISCHTNYKAVLLEGITDFSCQSDGTYNPTLPNNVELKACSLVFKQRMIILEIWSGLQCPIYNTAIVAAGLQNEITERYPPDSSINTLNIPIAVVVRGSGCDGKKRKRATDAFSLEIELSTEFDPSEHSEASVKNVLTNMMNQIRSDMLNKILSAVDVPVSPGDVSRTDPVIGCLRGEILQDENCIRCPVGTKASNDQCELCPENEYNDKAGSTNCKVCPDGKVTRETGSVSRSLCITKEELDAETSPPPDVGGSNMTTIIIAVVVVLAVIALIIIVVVVAVLMRRKNKDVPKKNHTDSFENPVFKDEGVYEEPPDLPIASAGGATYQGLSQKTKNEPNLYDNLNKGNGNGGSSNASYQDTYLEPAKGEV